MPKERKFRDEGVTLAFPAPRFYLNEAELTAYIARAEREWPQDNRQVQQNLKMAHHWLDRRRRIDGSKGARKTRTAVRPSREPAPASM